MREARTEDDADDAALVAAAREDQQAFAALYDRYLAPVYRFCYVRLGDREAAEDATSEVFLKAFAALGAYRGGAFAAWIYRIARNVVADRQRHGRTGSPIDVAEGIAAASPTLEEAAVAREERDELRTAITRLPEDQRAAVELRLAGWPDERVAATMGKTVAAVKKLRFRAIRRLRRDAVFTRELAKEARDGEE